MAATIFDSIVVFLYPLALLAAAWIIFNGATAGRDGISEVVAALIRTNGVEDGGKRGTGFSKNINSERQSDERQPSTQ
ncbi:hypothetical protein [Hyphomicrobium sp.]|uniref:hypothetical protein n=1 Tax=Hyphomicrobium sp. TaxID=82 RepID=UPI000FA8CBBC|nr:hypothetical protein [Hyphomicrobium sp.]RUP10566.1 MAG: hypothetical protein EKK38_03310 [Hyphomicrobium sp.]